MNITGKWKVTCYGIAMPMNLIGDTKIIADDKGYNLMQGTRWGWFSACNLGYKLILNYNDPRNPKWLREVRDHIYAKGDNWEGAFHYKGKAVFTFLLEPIADD